MYFPSHVTYADCPVCPGTHAFREYLKAIKKKKKQINEEKANMCSHQPSSFENQTAGRRKGEIESKR